MLQQFTVGFDWGAGRILTQAVSRELDYLGTMKPWRAGVTSSWRLLSDSIPVFVFLFLFQQKQNPLKKSSQ